ncbi:MAG TPA: A/G-specific adenine glycosylase [Puia sp.]|nr:A/G-specific adenine glycosylase [Puia sp.]
MNFKADFSQRLLKWHKNENIRAMPWKGEKDPYKIWLSEVILQQTRVEQGWAYYERFLEAFPTIGDLARAPEQKVFKLWEGLGYYSRCRNLIATAKKIVADHGGKFPSTYGEIRELKGVGPYTAAAIASFAFNLPHAVVDGNVVRVLSRYFGLFTPTDTTAGKKEYTTLADSLLDKEQPGIYNQAIMDFGAVVCKPQNPLCSTCNQQTACQAWQQGLVTQLPIKEKSIQKRQRWLTYFIIETPDEKVYIRQRTEKDIWEDLFEFVCWETDKEVYPEEILRSDFATRLFGKQSLTVRYISRIYRQELSHQTIRGQFVTVRLEKPLPAAKGYLAVAKQDLNEYAFPRFINAWLQDPTPLQNLF